MQLIAAGDTVAFHRLVDEYWKKVYGHAMSYMKSPRNAQELTQDVFVKLWQQRAQLTDIEHFKSYLFILSRNQIISAIRKKLRETTLDEDFDIPEDLSQPDRQLQYKEVVQWINKGIEALPPMRQQVFRMSRMQGMTHEEIAEQLGIARNTVKQHIVLALNSLREYLRQYTDIAPVLLAFVFLDR
ncbi:MAG TPA: RNA polymerase sigma-70 factor [Pseudobacter sp.]|nr:RNA polymerase sigma-70 factor [Pseudobacter sp.]